MGPPPPPAGRATSTAVDVWYLLTTETGKDYYFNRSKQLTQWERPKEGYVIDMREGAKDREGRADPGQGKAAGEKFDKSKRNSFAEMLQVAGSKLKNKTEKKKAGGAEKGAASVTSPLPKRASMALKEAEAAKGTKQGSSTAPSSNQASGKKARRSSHLLGTGHRQTDAVWEKKQAETYGTDTEAGTVGSYFYVNKETGQTQWDRPDGYESEDEIERRVETGEICFDRNQSVKSILQELDALVHPDGTMPGIVTDREEMLESGEDKDRRCEKRLRQIYLAIKYCGGTDEWEEQIQADEYELVGHIYLHWGKADKTPTRVRAITCILLDTFLKLDSSLIRSYADGEWGLNNHDFLANVELGLQEAHPDEGSLFSWLSLLYSFLTEVPTLPKDALPGEETLRILVLAMSASQEDVFLIATYVLLALNSHSGYTNELERPQNPETGEEDMTVTLEHTPNVVLRALQSDRTNGELFSEAVLHLVNGQSYPYEDPVLLGQLLYMLRAVFSTKSTNAFFHTTDLRVLIDIIILQLKDLPPDDEFRCDYLRLLHLIIINGSGWQYYRRADILDALDSILQEGTHNMHPLAIKFSVKILLDCVKQLQ